jgi:hypothetical protein
LNGGGTKGIERTRGIDLIYNPSDPDGHGTSVCGIINGGVVGRRRYVGVAPHAELLVVNKYAEDYNETYYIPWARLNGANVMLYEFGVFVQKFLDGSSNFETMINTEALLGIVQVAAAGNLSDSKKHAQNDVGGNNSTTFPFTVNSMDDPGTPNIIEPDITRVEVTVLWRNTGNDLAFKLTTPTPSTIDLPANPSGIWPTTSVDGHRVEYNREDSGRGTAKYDIIIRKDTVSLGGWALQVINNTANSEHVDLYIYNNNHRTKWKDGAEWTAYDSDENTVTWPATADTAITVAAYNIKGGSIGGLRSSSSIGPRIDGQAIVDVAAPGSSIGCALSKDADGGDLGWYTGFGGTSAAAPHVAAASALLLQSGSSLDHQQVKMMLQQMAEADSSTGPTPNNQWGYGKLNLIDFPSSPTVWVDFWHTGTELGTFMQPFNSLADGVSAVSPGGTLTIKKGSTSETGRVTKRLRIRPFGGNVTIGR